MNPIQIYTRSVYGRSLCYVADPAQAVAISTLTGAKTLEPRHLSALQDLGLTFVTVADPSSWLNKSNLSALSSVSR